MDQETFLRGRAHRDALPALRHVKVTVADATGSERGPLPRPGHLAAGHRGEHRAGPVRRCRYRVGLPRRGGAMSSEASAICRRRLPARRLSRSTCAWSPSSASRIRSMSPNPVICPRSCIW